MINMERLIVRSFIRCRQQTSLVRGTGSSVSYKSSALSSPRQTRCLQSNIYPSISRSLIFTQHFYFPTAYEFRPLINTSNSIPSRVFSSKTNAKSESKKGNKDSSGSSKSEAKKPNDTVETEKSQQPESTKPKASEETPKAIPSEPAAAPAAESEPCPTWQNPLHHKDTNLDKIMLEEYKNGENPTIVPLPPFDDGSGNAIAAPHLHQLADEIVNMSMLEVKDLTDRLAEHFGIEEDDDDMGGVVGTDSAGESKPAEEEKKEEKKTFDLKLLSYDEKSKIKVIKEIRAITNLGLKEAKDLVEGVPKVVKKDIKKEEAEELKAKLVAAGATVEIA
jgi:large subunit ribosomal protein L7/L12